MGLHVVTHMAISAASYAAPQVLGAASARLTAALQQCSPDSGIDMQLQRQALDTAIYFLECSAAAVADWLVPPADASPPKAALQPGGHGPAFMQCIEHSCANQTSACKRAIRASPIYTTNLQ